MPCTVLVSLLIIVRPARKAVTFLLPDPSKLPYTADRTVSTRLAFQWYPGSTKIYRGMNDSASYVVGEMVKLFRVHHHRGFCLRVPHHDGNPGIRGEWKIGEGVHPDATWWRFVTRAVLDCYNIALK